MAETDDYRERCWSCGAEFLPGQGFSFTDDGEEQICKACWGQICARDRVLVAWLLRSCEQGGSGIGQLVDLSGRQWPILGGPSKN